MSLLSPQLVAFLAVVRQKTVHGAASQLHLTQTAVTQRIRTLESNLGTTLFIRTRRGMQLTQEGEALLRYCQAASELEGETLAKIQGYGTETEIEIAISAPSSMMRSRIIPACLPIMKAYPNLLFRYQVEDSEQRHLQLRRGQCDFVVLQEAHLAAEMHHKKLKPEQYVLVGSSQWARREIKEIIHSERIIDFDENDQMTFNYLKKYNLFPLAQYARYFMNHTDSIAELVVAGLGYTALPKEFAEPFVQAGKLVVLNSHHVLAVTAVLAWYERPEMPSYFQAIISSID